MPAKHILKFSENLGGKILLERKNSFRITLILLISKYPNFFGLCGCRYRIIKETLELIQKRLSGEPVVIENMNDVLAAICRYLSRRVEVVDYSELMSLLAQIVKAIDWSEKSTEYNERIGSIPNAFIYTQRCKDVIAHLETLSRQARPPLDFPIVSSSLSRAAHI